MFGKIKTSLGVDIGAGGIKLVELQQKKGRPVLFTYAIAPDVLSIHPKEHQKIKSPEDLTIISSGKTETDKQDLEMKDEELTEERIKRYASLLKESLKKAKVIARSATVSLPVSSVFHAVITLPKMDKKEFDSVLKAKVQKLIPLPLEKMSLDYQIIDKGDNKDKTQKILINAVEKKRVSFYAKIFQEAGLILNSLEPESTALARTLIGKDKSVSMIVDIGAKRTNFFIVDNGFPMTHHSIEIGGEKVNSILQNRLGIEKELIESVKKDISNALVFDKNAVQKEKFLSMLSPITDPIIKEIGYSFEMYLRQQGNEGKIPEKIILTGGGSIFPFLTEYIEEKFQKKCFLGDPWARIVYQQSLRPLLNKVGPRMSVAVGLALRDVV